MFYLGHLSYRIYKSQVDAKIWDQMTQYLVSSDQEDLTILCSQILQTHKSETVGVIAIGDYLIPVDACKLSEQGKVQETELWVFCLPWNLISDAEEQQSVNRVETKVALIGCR